MTRIRQLIDKLEKNTSLSQEEYTQLIREIQKPDMEYLMEKAEKIRQKYYGRDIYVRGLIEFTNICKNNCYYCGIRSSNRNCERYRLTKKEILECCEKGWTLGYRTFVLQGGEDPAFTPEEMADIVKSIKSFHPECAVTLSFGEYPFEVYKLWKEAGADRYLLRHETANKKHYETLHPVEMSFDNRMRCLYDLKALGYQVGCGFMVGSPNQTPEDLAQDMCFIKGFKPDMVGVGPFIPHKDTPFKDMKAGTLEQTLIMLALIRLSLPEVLLPATTALGTIDPLGRELGIRAGANVCMPNLSPESVRNKYTLYDNKLCTGDEAAEYLKSLSNRMNKIGYNIISARGDRYGFKRL
ncbi:MAG: [FeFe] hydrogenase H-cluster radical SAM maturase HydE [Holdemanella sp.]|nr:[FeFe] hydrogenase H-cluster radical SAM maturase HydE [Holdemanella sp.]